MEENFEENYNLDTGSGNEKLGNICENIFLNNGQIGYYMLSKRVAEPAQEFENSLGEQEGPSLEMWWKIFLLTMFIFYG